MLVGGYTKFRTVPNTPQQLCNFILALALVYNDFKDVIIGHHAIDGLEPKDTNSLTPELGMYNALRLNMMRLHAGIFRELFDLIEASNSLLSLPLFVRLVGQLSPDGRAQWKALCDIAFQRPTENSDFKALLLVRNKVSFHYDAKAIFRGYQRCFIEDALVEPLLSRGNSMQATRFYFADAAAQSFLMEQAERTTLVAILTGRSPLVHAINVALYGIVTRFLAVRGFAWRAPRV